MKKQVVLTLHDPGHCASPVELVFDLLDLPITHAWLQQVQLFIAAGQPWDDPLRFYNFPKHSLSRADVTQRLRELRDLLAPYLPEALRPFPRDPDQDYLNYLHNIFERYHGLYDQQDTDFWKTAPPLVQQALADLNIWIHRFETLGGIPRFVGTWRGKPCRFQFKDDEFGLFSLDENWGDLRLNYCEIGKTLQDLAHDDDHYIGDDAFQPQHHYCFDFTVRFGQSTPAQTQALADSIWHYYDRHQEFFAARGYYRRDPRMALGGVTIGHLRYQDPAQIIDQIDRNQKLVSIALRD